MWFHEDSPHINHPHGFRSTVTSLPIGIGFPHCVAALIAHTHTHTDTQHAKGLRCMAFNCATTSSYPSERTATALRIDEKNKISTPTASACAEKQEKYRNAPGQNSMRPLSAVWSQSAVSRQRIFAACERCTAR